MKRNITFFSYILIAVFYLATGPIVGAVPADSSPFFVYQPDGTAVEVCNRGDEQQHWVETKKGCTIARDLVSKKWFYVDHYEGTSPVLTAVSADLECPEFLVRHLKPEKRQ